MTHWVKGISVFAVVAGSLCIASTVRAESERDRLLRKRALILDTLDRAKNGRDPCFTSECQQRKIEALTKSFRDSHFVTIRSEEFNEILELGLNSGASLVQQPIVPPNYSRFPKTFSEWRAWWKRRYVNKAAVATNWDGFVTRLSNMNQSLQRYLEVAPHWTDAQRSLLNEAWDRGLPEIARAVILHDWLKYLTEVYERSGDPQSVKRYERDMIAKAQVIERGKAAFKSRLEDLLAYLFPELHQTEALYVIDVVNQVMETYGESNPTTEAMRVFAAAEQKVVRSAWLSASDFDDLENGVWGLGNFYDPKVNPIEAQTFELPIQTFLDEVDSKARFALNLGALYFGSKLGGAILGPSTFERGLPILTLQLYEASSETGSWTTDLWAPSERTQDLTEIPLGFIQRMNKRRDALFAQVERLQLQLAEVETQLERETIQ